MSNRVILGSPGPGKVILNNTHFFEAAAGTSKGKGMSGSRQSRELVLRPISNGPGQGNLCAGINDRSNAKIVLLTKKEERRKIKDPKIT